jgi:hypothetical protein
MEKIMSKTNDTLRPATLDDHHTLADSELDAVTGGMLILSEPVRASTIMGGPVCISPASTQDGTTKTRELTEAELAAVSGGVFLDLQDPNPPAAKWNWSDGWPTLRVA